MASRKVRPRKKVAAPQRATKRRPVRAVAKPKPLSRAGSYAVAIADKSSVAARVKALRGLGQTVCQPKTFSGVLKILKNARQPEAVRLAALQALQSASFAVIRFAQLRPEYLATLRSIVSDASHEIRQRVLGMLAREQDGFAQQALLNGLKDPGKALLPPEKALQLLSNDPHAEAYQAARAIAAKPPNATARREALRLLGSDASALPMFEAILADRSEPSDVRQLSATILHAEAPEKLQAKARQVVLDKSEDKDLQATCLTALTQFGKAELLTADKELVERIGQLKNEGDANSRQEAQRFLSKYRR